MISLTKEQRQFFEKEMTGKNRIHICGLGVITRTRVKSKRAYDPYHAKYIEVDFWKYNLRLSRTLRKKISTA